ncbi:MAG: hypothetical protein PHI23_03945 [Candidatus Peribacteraceae bacterium]|nr:hypothetical protein [Candidatus Peribacteraceae bacterium]
MKVCRRFKRQRSLKPLQKRLRALNANPLCRPQRGTAGSTKRTDLGHEGEPSLTADERAETRRRSRFSSGTAAQEAAGIRRRRELEEKAQRAAASVQRFDYMGRPDRYGSYNASRRYIGPPPY